jgi:Fur family ferric uptake transcriptional regulator/Fur family peroxide stress response transcriptional regulator
VAQDDPDSGGIVYDPRVDDHHHVICRSCGRVQDMDAHVDTTDAEAAAKPPALSPATAS